MFNVDRHKNDGLQYWQSLGFGLTHTCMLGKLWLDLGDMAFKSGLYAITNMLRTRADRNV